MYKRLILNSFPPAHSAFLFGPRQCGKSTILREINNLLYIDLLNSDELLTYTLTPSLLYDRVSSLKSKEGVIIIDEVQKAPILLNEVQRCIDKFKNIYFLLSGSSARKLRTHTTNMLGGRALYSTLHPLTAYELDRDFDIDKALSYGSLPKIADLYSSGETQLAVDILYSYIKVYLNEEIRQEALVRKLDSFQRFLEVAAHQATFEINYEKISDDAQVSASTVKNYYNILEDTLIGNFLTPWSTSVRKELSKTSKFYLFDNGVCRAIQGLLAAPPSNIERGRLFEQWVVGEVIRLNAYLKKNLKVHFWKTIHGSEVDIVIARGKELLLAIECKASEFPSARDVSGIKSFHEEHPNVKAVVCAPVKMRAKMTDRIEIISPKDLYEEIEAL